MDVLTSSWHSGGMSGAKFKLGSVIAALLIYALAIQGVLAAASVTARAASFGQADVFGTLCRVAPAEPHDKTPVDHQSLLHCVSLCALGHAGFVAAPDLAAEHMVPVSALASILQIRPSPSPPARSPQACLGARGPPQLG